MDFDDNLLKFVKEIEQIGQNKSTNFPIGEYSGWPSEDIFQRCGLPNLPQPVGKTTTYSDGSNNNNIGSILGIFIISTDANESIYIIKEYISIINSYLSDSNDFYFNNNNTYRRSLSPFSEDEGILNYVEIELDKNGIILRRTISVLQ